MIKNIFGAYQAEIDFTKWSGGQCDQVLIKNIDFNEDLLTVLQRLRESFWVEIQTDGEIEKFNGGKTVFTSLNIELILRECNIEKKGK